MAKSKPFSQIMLPGEDDLLAGILANRTNETALLVYADWLEEKNDELRAGFLREFAHFSKTLDEDDWPITKGFPEEWLELIGVRLAEGVTEAETPDLKDLDRVLRLARPALRMQTADADDESIAVGASKIGGLPDLPSDFPWPTGADCHGPDNKDARGGDRLAGFMAQVSLAEIAGTQAGRLLPREGLLSFFCFQDFDLKAFGATATLFPDMSGIRRTSPSKELTNDNGVIPPQRLTFEETLDLPGWDSPWGAELNPEPNSELHGFLGEIRDLNFHNMLGYARSTTGNDPTPSKKYRHLIVLKNAIGCQLHIQIDEDDLAARRFERITLNWVDFD